MSVLLQQPRRSAFAGDWHENLDYALHAVEYAAEQNADVIIHVGDFGYSFSAPFLDGLTEELERHGLDLGFVDGNHENFRRLYTYPVGPDGTRRLTSRIWHLPRGLRWTWSGVSFLAMGGAYSVDRPWRKLNRSWWAEETITVEQAQDAIAGGETDVLVSHDCPLGVDIPGLQSNLFPPEQIAYSQMHRALLRQIVDKVQPRRIFHGHYHQRYDQTVNLGYGQVDVTGLDCDGFLLPTNVQVVDVAELGGR